MLHITVLSNQGIYQHLFDFYLYASLIFKKVMFFDKFTAVTATLFAILFCVFKYLSGCIKQSNQGFFNSLKMLGTVNNTQAACYYSTSWIAILNSNYSK